MELPWANRAVMELASSTFCVVWTDGPCHWTGERDTHDTLARATNAGLVSQELNSRLGRTWGQNLTCHACPSEQRERGSYPWIYDATNVVKLMGWLSE